MSREQTQFYIRCTCDFTRRWYTMSWPLTIKCHDQEDNTKNISVTEFDKALRTYNFPRKTKHLSPVTRTVTNCHHLSSPLLTLVATHICERWDPFLRFFTGLGMWIDLDRFGWWDTVYFIICPLVTRLCSSTWVIRGVMTHLTSYFPEAPVTCGQYLHVWWYDVSLFVMVLIVIEYMFDSLGKCKMDGATWVKYSLENSGNSLGH